MPVVQHVMLTIHLKVKLKISFHIFTFQHLTFSVYFSILIVHFYHAKETHVIIVSAFYITGFKGLKPKCRKKGRTKDI